MVAALHDASPRRARDAELYPCRENGGELWFADRPEQVELAKSMCGDCAVRESCLAGAVERREPWGVWGGELFENGVVIARKVPRGRPRKDDPRYLEAAARRAAEAAQPDGSAA